MQFQTKVTQSKAWLTAKCFGIIAFGPAEQYCIRLFKLPRYDRELSWIYKSLDPAQYKQKADKRTTKKLQAEINECPFMVYKS